MTHKQNIAWGINVINFYLTHAPEKLLSLHIIDSRQDKRFQRLIDNAQKLSIPISYHKASKLAQMAENANHQGIIAQCRLPAMRNEGALEKILKDVKAPLLLILDSITDAHNFGACIRTAEACNIDAVIVPKHNSAPLSATVLKTSSGAALTLPVIEVPNLSRALKKLQQNNIWIYGLSEYAEKEIYAVNFAAGTALVMGAEGKGLRELTKKSCDELVKIPMHGKVSSLNISVAASVCLYEAVRQRAN